MAAASDAARGAATSVFVVLEAMAQSLFRVFRRGLDSSHLYRALRRLWRERFTARGRFVFVLSALVGLVGLDTRQALVYQLFAFAIGPLVVAAVLAARRPPRVRLTGGLPRRVTAGRPVTVGVRVETGVGRDSGPLVVSWAGPDRFARGVSVEPRDSFVDCGPGAPAHVRLEMTTARRGRYVVPGLGVSGTDPVGLLATRRCFRQPTQAVLAYPRFFHVEDLSLPLGRRYQPGGIPLASSLGDLNEFVSTREFREGDPLRRIHWRSWARRGEPVVKEYQEEYFSRIALVLDTFLPRGPRERERAGFEAGVSVLASIADYFSRTENIVDIFAAGPDVYRVRAGRSLAYLENVLDILACLEPCHDPPFARVGPHLHERLGGLATVVAVVLDWDAERHQFLAKLHEMGVAVRTVVVHAGPTRRPWEDAVHVLGEIRQIEPREVEHRIALEERP